MKKLRNIIALTILFCILGCGSAMAADYTIEVNGQKLDTEVKVIDGRTLIPLRAVGEALGVQVKYDSPNNTVVLYLTDKSNQPNNIVVLYLNTAKVDIAILGRTDIAIKDIQQKDPNEVVNKYFYAEEGFELQVPPINDNGRVYVPVRFLCNLFSAPLQLDGNVIKIGSIFSTEKRGNIEALRKTSVAIPKPVTAKISAPISDPVIGPGIGFGVNSANGINVYWSARNDSGKTIKYCDIYIDMLNRVDDPAYDEITGQSTIVLSGVGPIDPGDKLGIVEIIGYSSVCNKITIRKLEVEYMDGTKETIAYGYSGTYNPILD